jgi:hypothetical protein
MRTPSPLLLAIVIAVLSCSFWSLQVLSQVPLPPQNLRATIVDTDAIALEMEFSTGATYHEVDAAEDSTFQRYVRGYQSYPVWSPQPIAQIISIDGVLPNKRYYVRARGVNSQGYSAYSTTAIVTTRLVPSAVDLRIRDITDSSVVVRWTPVYIRDMNQQLRVIEQHILYLQRFNTIVSTATRTLSMSQESMSQDTIFEARFSGLPPNTGFFFTVEGRQGSRAVFDGRIYQKGFMTAVRNTIVSQFKQQIEVGEWLRLLPSTDRSLYFYFPFASPIIPRSVERVDSILGEMWQAGLPVDTAWFHTGGFVEREYRIATRGTRPPLFIVKLKRPDNRVTRWGLEQGLFRATFSLGYEYYRYVFPERVMSAVGGSAALMMTMNVHPQPASSEVVVGVDVPRACSLELTVVDVLGRSVASLPAQAYAAGQHSITLNVGGLPSGVYSVRVQSSDRSVLQQHPLVVGR